MDSEGNYQKIKAKVPLSEMNRYSTALSSITSGSGTYSLKFAEYSQVPPDVQNALLKAYEDRKRKKNRLHFLFHAKGYPPLAGSLFSMLSVSVAVCFARNSSGK
jgi:lipopolysaccharide export LptBFGC system permease protein LptF